jgi:superfamily II DNA/RNA helicase
VSVCLNEVDHVILFDFPRNAVDYLHRVGRTARVGRIGKVTALITKRDRELADRIMVRSFFVPELILE